MDLLGKTYAAVWAYWYLIKNTATIMPGFSFDEFFSLGKIGSLLLNLISVPPVCPLLQSYWSLSFSTIIIYIQLND